MKWTKGLMNFWFSLFNVQKTQNWDCKSVGVKWIVVEKRVKKKKITNAKMECWAFFTFQLSKALQIAKWAMIEMQQFYSALTSFIHWIWACCWSAASNAYVIYKNLTECSYSNNNNNNTNKKTVLTDSQLEKTFWIEQCLQNIT